MCGKRWVISNSYRCCNLSGQVLKTDMKWYSRVNEGKIYCLINCNPSTEGKGGSFTNPEILVITCCSASSSLTDPFQKSPTFMCDHFLHLPCEFLWLTFCCQLHSQESDSLMVRGKFMIDMKAEVRHWILHSLIFIDAYWMFMETKQMIWAQLGNGLVWFVIIAYQPL